VAGHLFEELKRRKVFKVGAAYLVVAWLAVQAASIGFPAFDAPPWALRVFILVALLLPAAARRRQLRMVWFPSNLALREDPRVFAIAERKGMVRLWEARGYPSGCRRVRAAGGDQLDCP
jgi:hypothetical protein